MSIKYEHYAKIKDKVCMLYAGHCTDYIIIMKLIRPLLEAQFPGMTIFIACRDELLYLLRGQPRVVPRSTIKRNVNQYGYIKEIDGRMSGSHPLIEVLTESGLEVPVVSNVSETNSRLCCIFTEGSLPTKSMSKDIRHECEAKAKFDGFEVWVNPKFETIEQAGWVISVEQAALYEAAANGTKTTLVPTGVGKRLYQIMFPKGEIWKI
jgi:hypothetical protein